MEAKLILEIDSQNKKKFSSKKEYYDLLMYELQSHLVELDDLKQEGSSRNIQNL
jgi:hypothetical protein